MSNNEYDVNVNSSIYFKAGLNSGYLTSIPADIGVTVEWDPSLKGLESMEIKLKFALNL